MANELTQRPLRPMWRPWTLRTPSLSLFIALCVFLLIGTEMAIRGCAKGGCHVFGKSADGSVPPASHFVYRQLPTALSVALSLLWILPHHDICRLEPYFRMSAKGGEKAGESLLLDYPYQIAVLMPIRALYNKHYVVALSSMTLLLMNLVIVPFVANIFDMPVGIASFEGNVTRVSPDVVGNGVSASSSFEAYRYAWHQGNLAPFMTDTYTLLPVRADGHTFFKSENWTVETTLFEAEFKCIDAAPPTIGYFNNTLTVNITSVDGNFNVTLCDAGAVEQNRLMPEYHPECQAYVAFITPWTSVDVQIPVSEGNYIYMYLWASGLPSPPNIYDNFTFPGPKNITAVFCTPIYYSENIKATVSMPPGTVLNITRPGSRNKIKSVPNFDGIINGYVMPDTAGEGLLFGWLVPIPVRFGYSPGATADVATDLIARFGQSRRPINTPWLELISRSNVYIPTTNSLASFSLLNQSNSTLGELLDPQILGRATESGLKVLFAFAMAEAVNNYTTATQAPVERKAWEVRIMVNQGWARAARIGLSVIVLLVSLLLFLIRRRPCELNGEPNSMAVSLRLLSASPALCRAMRYAEFYDLKLLSDMMDADDLFFKLDLDTENRMGSTIRVLRGNGDSAVEVVDLELLPDPGDTMPKKTKKPWTAMTSMGLLGYFPILAGLLIALFAYSRAHNGFPVYGNPYNLRSKVLYTYLPLAAASAIEFILIDIGERQCIMGPYKALEKGEALYSKSLAADYDKSPPHFQLRSSVINGEYALAILSVAILLSNILAVAIVGLLPPAHHAELSPRSHQILNNFTTPKQDMYFELEGALLGDDPPTWTTPHFYVDPPYQVTPGGEGEYNTIGFGIDIVCAPVSDEIITFPCSSQYNFSQSQCEPVASLHMDNVLAVADPCGTGTSDPMYFSWNGSCGDRLIYCTDRIYPMWFQNMKFNVTPADSTDSEPGPLGATDNYQFVALNCSLADNIVNLTAKVKDGDVLSLDKSSPLDTMQLASLYGVNSSPVINTLSRSFASVLNESIKNDAPSLQNLRLARINYLMALQNPQVVGEPRNMTHIPNKLAAAQTFEDVVRYMFVMLLKSSADDIFPNNTTPGQGDTNTYRVHVDTASFAVSLSIVLFSCGAIVAAYWEEERKVVGHLPWSLAAMYSHLYASNVKQDMVIAREMSMKQIREHNEGLQRTYKYGKYPDGKHHGVYRMQAEVQEIEAGGLLTEQKKQEVTVTGLEIDSL